MSERSAGSRIRTLFVDLFLASINATLVLVVIALVLLLVVLNKAETLQRSIAARIATEIVEPVRVQAQQIKAQIETLNRELQSRPRHQLGSSNVDEDAAIGAMAGQLRNLGRRIDELSKHGTDLGPMFADRIIQYTATAFAEAVIRIRNCEASTTGSRDNTAIEDDYEIKEYGQSTVVLGELWFKSVSVWSGWGSLAQGVLSPAVPRRI